ncbi:unnamed protein product [Chrysodeixis includens]|uniref:Uncharacterized protein n=1 Tax=Chrysodeixis includens TaxID=689277 RepID=A0A9P0FSR3_CHRIL|nr:unnamed protein product [Chrysodeixis includens]
MHALSKKLCYDVMKSGREDTIIESVSENNCFDDELNPKCNKEVGCFVRAHMKSNAIQTQLIRNCKNFRHDSTNTSEFDKELKLLKSPLSRILSIHSSCEDLSISQVQGVQTSSSLELTPTVMRCYDNGADFYAFQVYSNKSGPSPHSQRQVDKCTTADCDHSDKCEECHCHFCHVPRNRGLAACHNFTLGTLQHRRAQRENRKTKMIGGSRVPVCGNHKIRY